MTKRYPGKKTRFNMIQECGFEAGMHPHAGS